MMFEFRGLTLQRFTSPVHLYYSSIDVAYIRWWCTTTRCSQKISTSMPRLKRCTLTIQTILLQIVKYFSECTTQLSVAKTTSDEMQDYIWQLCMTTRCEFYIWITSWKGARLGVVFSTSEKFAVQLKVCSITNQVHKNSTFKE